jgi:hypothetical protein
VGIQVFRRGPISLAIFVTSPELVFSRAQQLEEEEEEAVNGCKNCFTTRQHAKRKEPLQNGKMCVGVCKRKE